MNSANCKITNKRLLLEQTMKAILNQLPDNHSAKIHMQSKLISLSYAAPELVENWWIYIHKILVNYVPISDDDNNNLQWEINIKNIWSKALKDQKSFKNAKDPP